MKILTSGVDSEYVLTELCGHLRSSGHDVTELDFGQITEPAENLLAPHINKDVIYITSAHSNLTLDNAKHLVPIFNKHYPNYLSPLEIINKVNPKISIYIPHDLLTPFGDTNLNEFRFLDLFDYILTPFSSQSLQAVLARQTKVIEAGWIKHSGLAYSSKSPEAPAKARVTLFITMFEHLRWKYGEEGLVDYFAPLIRDNVKVKLPVWRGANQVETIFNARFIASIIPAAECSIRAILDADIVLCNGASSIHAEAILMGRPTICLLDDEGLLADEQRSKLAHLNTVIFHDYRQRAPLTDDLINNAVNLYSRPPSKHFDVGLVEEIIKHHG